MLSDYGMRLCHCSEEAKEILYKNETRVTESVE